MRPLGACGVPSAGLVLPVLCAFGVPSAASGAAGSAGAAGPGAGAGAGAGAGDGAGAGAGAGTGAGASAGVGWWSFVVVRGRWWWAVGR